MHSERESEKLFSLRLSRVMGDIGVNRWVIARRRRAFLRMETLYKVKNLLDDLNTITYVFGSQSEATTTIGMESDTDSLRYNNNEHVALNFSDWQYGKTNLLVLKNELTPPQHCYLQRLRGDCPLPALQAVGPDDVLDGEGRILVANTCVELQDWVQRQTESGDIIRHGPSLSFDKKFDIVKAYHCSKLPGECRFMFHRPRPGHWPRHDTLASASEVGVFLVPQGYTESPAKQLMCRSTALMVPSKLTSYPYSKWQWRFSTSLIERILIFDLCPVQVKIYTLTKIIRISFFKPVFGDRFSTFHIKTAMMFTIENYPAEIWREDNIVKCVCLLLKTLKRWVKQKYCPHFTISGVNLFVGKLNFWEFPELCSIITKLINTKLQCLFRTRMDNIGLRLQQCSGIENIPSQNVSTRTQTCSVLKKLLFEEVTERSVHMDGLITILPIDSIKRHLLVLQSFLDSREELEKEVASLWTPFLCSTYASMLASRCISLGQAITSDILTWYQLSLDSDLMSSRLKFASMLYCSGQYEVAAKVLTYCEGLLGPEVCQCCGHHGRKHLEPSTEFMNKVITLSTTEVLKKRTMVCITFTMNEIRCIPQHLIFEMLRRIGVDPIVNRERWKWIVVSDCIPFLYYLQHLTYRELHQHRRARTALHNLREYTKGTTLGHIDTALNMLGHCYELLNRLDLALMCYSKSLEMYDTDNASIYHADRILDMFLPRRYPH